MSIIRRLRYNLMSMVADPQQGARSIHPKRTSSCSKPSGTRCRARSTSRARAASSSIATCAWTRSSSSASTWTTRWRSTPAQPRGAVDPVHARQAGRQARLPRGDPRARLRSDVRRARPGGRSPARQHLQDGSLRPRRARLSRAHAMLDARSATASTALERIRLSSPRYAWIDTLFALPEAVMYSAHGRLLREEGRGASATASCGRTSASASTRRTATRR